MRQVYLMCLAVLTACIGCQWQMQRDEPSSASVFAIDRYDQAEHRYLTTGDFSALQQLQTGYPSETRTLIEDVLQIGRVDEADINQRFYHFFQDSTLQQLLADVDSLYADMGDVDRQLGAAFARLQQLLPGIGVPRVYAQIGSLDQSIIVGDSMLGISLDKYLGADHPVYLRYGYSDGQRSTMTRDFIVPDCIGFYLLSLYPFPEAAGEAQRRQHIAAIQHVVNRAVGHRLFDSAAVLQVEDSLGRQPGVSADSLLRAL